MYELRLQLALRRIPATSRLGDRQLQEIGRVIHPVSLRPGQYLFRQGDAGGAMFLLVSGALQVELHDGLGGPGVAIGTVTAGEFVGEMGLFDDAPRSAAVVALTACELGELDAAALTELERDCPAAASALIAAVGHNLTQRIHSVNETLEWMLAPAPAAVVAPVVLPARHGGISGLWARLTGN